MMADFAPAIDSLTPSPVTTGGASSVSPLAASNPSPADTASARPVNPTLAGGTTGALDSIAARVRAQAPEYAPRPLSDSLSSTVSEVAPRRARAQVRRSGTAGKAAPDGHGAPPARPGGAFSFPLGMPQPSQIEHLVEVVPGTLWIALACALSLAGIGGAAAVRSNRRARRQAGQYAAVAAVALTDPLTGVLNRRGFTDAVERELARARRYETPFVLAYIDIRGLKAVNDTEGHLAGDELIKQVTSLLSDAVRAEDAVGRLGGDEFGLLLTGQSARGAEAVIRRIQAGVPACRLDLGITSPWSLTIGTAGYPADGDTFDELLSTADRRLYEQRGIQLR